MLMGLIGDKKPSGGGGGLDPDTTAWVNQVVSNGGSVSTTSKGFVDTLVKAFKADTTICPAGNLNDTIDQLWLTANFDTTGSNQTTDAQALTSLVNPTAATALATPHGSWTSNTLGWKGNGTDGYIDLGYNPTTFTGAKFSQNSACYGVYGLDTRASTDSKIAIGAFAGGTINQLLIDPVSAAVDGINDGGGMDSVGNEIGLNILIRSGSAGANANQIQTYSGGTTSKTGINTSSAPSNIKFFACARNNNATPDSFETVKIGLIFIGGRSGTNAAYAAALFTPIQAYMTSLGIQQ